MAGLQILEYGQAGSQEKLMKTLDLKYIVSYKKQVISYLRQLALLAS